MPNQRLMAFSRRKSLIPVAIVLLLSTVWVTMSTTFTLDAGDFGAFYTGALMAKSGNFESLHDARMQARLQGPFMPTRPVPVYFVRPHVYAAFLAPLAMLSIRNAFAVWVALLSLILAACWLWAYKRFGSDAVVLAALFPAAIFSIGFGQDVVLFLGLSVLSYWLFERGRPALSGFVLGLCFIKPHLLLLLPFALCIQRRWRMLGGLLLAGAAEALVSLWLGGFQGASLYLQFLRSHSGDLSPTPERMLNVQSIALNMGASHGSVELILIAVVLCAVVLVSRRGEWWKACAAAWAGTLLIAPHTYLYDSALMILPALLIFFRSSSKLSRAMAAVILTPIPSMLQLAEKPFTIAPALVVFLLLLCEAASAISAERQEQPLPLQT